MDRIEIFKELTFGEFQKYDPQTAERLLGDYYTAFSHFCHCVKEMGECGDKEIVKTVSCAFDHDEVHFKVDLSNGISREVVMSKEREKEFRKANS